MMMSSIRKRLLRRFDLLGLTIFFSTLVAGSFPATSLLKKIDRPATANTSNHISYITNKLSLHQNQAHNIGSASYSAIQEIFFYWRFFAARTFRQKVFYDSA